MSDKKKWTVNDGTQVAIGDKMLQGGETFTATDAEVDEHGSRPYVTEAEDKAEAKHKAVAPPDTHGKK